MILSYDSIIRFYHRILLAQSVIGILPRKAAEKDPPKNRQTEERQTCLRCLRCRRSAGPLNSVAFIIIMKPLL